MGDISHLIKVSVPGSTSNLGSGFDTLGIALSLRNELHVQPALDTKALATIDSPIPDNERQGAERMLRKVCEFFEAKTGVPVSPIRVSIQGDVPIARGLGSSVTVRIGLLMALSELHQVGLSTERIGQWVSEIEGHPDNAMPSALGGFVAAGIAEDHRLEYMRIELPHTYQFVTLIPDFEVKTEEARKSLPDHYSRAEAVKALNRAAMVTGLMATGEIQKLKGFFDDPIHQPFRGPLIPGMKTCMQAGIEAGAIGGWISGSGSTLMWLTEGSGEVVGEAVQSQMPSADLKVLKPDNKGAIILEQNS